MKFGKKPGKKWTLNTLLKTICILQFNISLLYVIVSFKHLPKVKTLICGLSWNAGNHLFHFNSAALEMVHRLLSLVWANGRLWISSEMYFRSRSCKGFWLLLNITCEKWGFVGNLMFPLGFGIAFKVVVMEDEEQAKAGMWTHTHLLFWSG